MHDLFAIANRLIFAMKQGMNFETNLRRQCRYYYCAPPPRRVH